VSGALLAEPGRGRARRPGSAGTCPGLSRGFAALVDEAPFVEIAIDCLENGDKPTDLFDGDALNDRKLERLSEVSDDLRRAGLEKTRRMNAVLHGVRVAWMGGNERAGISFDVHSIEYAAGHHAAINADSPPGHFNRLLVAPVSPQATE
jgi:hypothetical protein